jgi:hypothetical protein
MSPIETSVAFDAMAGTAIKETISMQSTDSRMKVFMNG